MIGVDGEWTRLLKILSDAVFSEVSFDPVLLGRDWSMVRLVVSPIVAYQLYRQWYVLKVE